MAVITYKCPNCGGELRFDPETQKYKCPYCLSLVTQEEADAAAAEGGYGFGPAQEAVLFRCPSCGAELVTDDTTAATFCFYCHNPVILSGRLSGAYLPDKIIPFRMTKEQAKKEFLSFVRKRKFTPKAFFSENQIEKLSPIYFPYWICRASGRGSLRASAKTVNVWRAGKTEYTKTRIYEVDRDGDFILEELPKSALSKGNLQLCEGVWPYDLTQCRDFAISYLSGFLAEKRDLEREDFQSEFDRDIQEYTEKAMRDTVEGYDSVTVEESRTEDVEQTWEYVLLPAWVLTYRGKDGKTYYYAMNGQNGKFAGSLPADPKKLAVLFFVVAFPVLVLCLLGGLVL